MVAVGVVVAVAVGVAVGVVVGVAVGVGVAVAVVVGVAVAVGVGVAVAVGVVKKPDKPWRSNASARLSKSYLTGYEQKLPIDKSERIVPIMWAGKRREQ